MFNRIAPLINVLHGDGLAPGGSCIGPGDVFFTQPLRLSTWTANSCSTFLLWKRNGTPHQSQRKGAADQMLCFLKAWRRIWNFFRNFFLHGLQSKVISGTSSEWSSMCQTFLGFPMIVRGGGGKCRRIDPACYSNRGLIRTEKVGLCRFRESPGADSFAIFEESESESLHF